MAVCLMGYFVVYVHTNAFVKEALPDCDGRILITCIAAMSLVSRVICGPIADLPYVNIVALQQVCNALLVSDELGDFEVHTCDWPRAVGTVMAIG